MFHVIWTFIVNILRTLKCPVFLSGLECHLNVTKKRLLERTNTDNIILFGQWSQKVIKLQERSKNITFKNVIDWSCENVPSAIVCRASCLNQYKRTLVRTGNKLFRKVKGQAPRVAVVYLRPLIKRLIMYWLWCAVKPTDIDILCWRTWRQVSFTNLPKCLLWCLQI